MKNPKIGFIGLGTMGAPMAWNINKAGYSIGVYNRSSSRTKPFKEAGIDVYRNPLSLTQDSDLVFIIVSDDAALKEVIIGPEGVTGGLSSGKMVINMSTVSETTNQEMADAVALENGKYIEAPVSGTKKPAEEGALTFLTAGPKEQVDTIDPILRTMGNSNVYCGELGYATKMKLTINLLLGNMLQAFTEALVFGQKQGLPLNAILETIGSGPLNAPLFQGKGNLIKNRNFNKQFPVNLLLKDLNLISEAAQKHGCYLPATATTREAVSAANAMGHADEDMAAIVKFLEEIAFINNANNN